MQEWHPLHSRGQTRNVRATEKGTTHTNVTFGQKGRDSMVLVHWVHKCLLFSQQSFSHKDQEERNNTRTAPFPWYPGERKARVYASLLNTDTEDIQTVSKESLKGRKKVLAPTWRFSRPNTTASGPGSRNTERYLTAVSSLDIYCGLLLGCLWIEAQVPHGEWHVFYTHNLSLVFKPLSTGFNG